MSKELKEAQNTSTSLLREILEPTAHETGKVSPKGLIMLSRRAVGKDQRVN